MKKYTSLFILVIIFFVGAFIGLLLSLFLYFGWILALLIGFKMNDMDVLYNFDFFVFSIGIGAGGMFVWSALPDLGGLSMAWGTTLFMLVGFYIKKIYLYLFPSKSLPK